MYMMRVMGGMCVMRVMCEARVVDFHTSILGLSFVVNLVDKRRYEVRVGLPVLNLGDDNIGERKSPRGVSAEPLFLRFVLVSACGCIFSAFGPLSSVFCRLSSFLPLPFSFSSHLVSEAGWPAVRGLGSATSWMQGTQLLQPTRQKTKLELQLCGPPGAA